MNESGIKSVLKKLYFFCLPTQLMRSRFIKKHAHEFKHIGGDCRKTLSPLFYINTDN